MLQARIVRLEGVDQPCILLAPAGELPEELVIDFGTAREHVLIGGKGPRTYRLEPSSAHEAKPGYRMLFEE